LINISIVIVNTIYLDIAKKKAKRKKNKAKQKIKKIQNINKTIQEKPNKHNQIIKLTKQNNYPHP